MKLKKYFYIFGIIIFFFILRLYHLTVLPIFNDEAIYTYWGQEMLHNSKLFFYSLYDAKPPLLMWIFGLAVNIFHDPLIGGRLVSILCGLLTLIGLYSIGKMYFSKRVGIIASFFYSIVPLFHFYDRQALMESAIGSITVWVVFFILTYIRTPTIQTIIILGILIGLGIWIKTNAILLLLPVVIILLLYGHLELTSTSQKLRNKFGKTVQSKFQIFFKITSVLLFTIIISILPLLLQPEFWRTISSNSRYSLTISELLHFPVLHWITNIKGIIDIIFWQITPIITWWIILGLLVKHKTQTNSIIVFSFSLIILIVLITRTMNPRYIVSFLPPLLITASIGLDWIIQKNNIFLTSLFLLINCVPFGLTLLQSFHPLSYFSLLSRVTGYSQEWEYVKNWSSGYGIPETVAFLREQSKKKHILVGVRIDSGNPESAIMSYFFNNPNITPIFVDTKYFQSSGFNCISSTVPFYFIARDGIINDLLPTLVEMKRFYKSKQSAFINQNKSYISIHKLNPFCKGKTIRYEL